MCRETCIPNDMCAGNKKLRGKCIAATLSMSRNGTRMKNFIMSGFVHCRYVDRLIISLRDFVFCSLNFSLSLLAVGSYRVCMAICTCDETIDL